MMPFDPYLNWLGIPVHEQPPNFYRLLGVVLFESNPHVVEQAADRQSLLVGAYQTGPYSEFCQQLLSEIAMARFNLLDPQQKASYDAHLQEGLAQRGERVVSAPPPPSGYGAPAPMMQPQFGRPGEMQPMGMPGPMTAPHGPMAMPQSPMMPMQPAMPQSHRPQSPMPGPMSPATMSPGTNFPARPAPMPIAMPVAAPFQTAQATGNGQATATAAPPTVPPAAPQRPMDEIENLTSGPSTRRRFVKKKQKKDYTKEMVIGGIVAAFAGLLIIVFIAVNSQGTGKTGFEGAVDNGANDPTPTPITSAAEKAKDKKKDKKASAVADDQGANDHGAQNVASHKPRQKKNDSSSDDSGSSFTIKIPASKPSELRPLDRPDTNPPVREQDNSPPQASHDTPGHDTPRDLGGDNDPVMELPKPDDSKDAKPDEKP